MTPQGCGGIQGDGSGRQSAQHPPSVQEWIRGPKEEAPSRLSAARSPGDLEVIPDNNPGDRETLKCVCEDVFCGGQIESFEHKSGHGLWTSNRADLSIKIFFFLTWTIFKVFIEFVTILFWFMLWFFLAARLV